MTFCFYLFKFYLTIIRTTMTFNQYEIFIPQIEEKSIKC